MEEPKLYEEIAEESLYQGDIFQQIDFFVTKPEPLITTFPKNENTSSSFSSDSDEQKIKSIKEDPQRLVAIISQTCDMDDSDYVLVSPIYTFEDYKNELVASGKSQNVESNFKLIRERKKMLDKFYLKSFENSISESFVDLKKASTVSKELLVNKKRVISLSHWGRQVLNFQLMWVYGRPIVEWK